MNSSKTLLKGFKDLKGMLRDFHSTLLDLEHVEDKFLPKDVLFDMLRIHISVNMIWDRLNKAIKYLEK